MGSFNVALLEALLSAGVAPDRARAVVDLFERSVDERYSLHAQVLATKRDVAELETRLSREVAELETRLSRDIASVEARLSRELAELSGRVTREIAAGKVDLVKWAIGALTAQTALLMGASRLL